MKEKIKQHRDLTNEITQFAKQKFKEFFKGKLKRGDRVIFEQWLITPDNELRIFFKMNDNVITDSFIVNI